MRLTSTTIALACLALVAGCRETASCADGQHYDPAPGVRGCVAGNPADAGVDAPVDSGTDAGPPCRGECVDVEHCNQDTGLCLECIEDSECGVATTPSCSASGTCVGCDTDERCAEIDATRPNCLPSGACEPCTAANEATVCGATRTCDIPTATCTAIPPSTVGLCGACGSDRQCMTGLCVPMFYDGTARAGGFCLTPSPGSCTVRPFTTVLPARVSLSGAPSNAYCGPNELVTTCEAVNALRSSVTCAAPDGGPVSCSGGLLGAICDTVGGNPDWCTYECGTDDDCPTGRTCVGLPGHCG